MRTFDPLKLNALDPRRIGNAAMGSVSGLPGFSPEEMVAGLAHAFLSTCKAIGVEPADAFRVAEKARRVSVETWPEYGAVENYIRAELTGERRR